MAVLRQVNAGRTQDMPLNEACQVVQSYSSNHQKEESLLIHALFSIIKNVRKKEKSKERILVEYIGNSGLMKIYRIRKLSGRLMCELTFNSDFNQNALTELFAFSPANGKVCLNHILPEPIKQRLQNDITYLEKIRNYKDDKINPYLRRYWSFPSFKDDNDSGKSVDLERSMTPSREQTNSVNIETLEEYLRFPDPHKYMIGFISKKENADDNQYSRQKAFILTRKYSRSVNNINAGGATRKSHGESENSSDSPSTLNVLLKKLNKPQMLLLNHLQNQIKQYYPDQVKNHKWLQEELGLTEDEIVSSTRKNAENRQVDITQRRLASDQQIQLPISLKTKMKNLIQTLEKEQLSIRRPNSQQKPDEVSNQILEQQQKLRIQREYQYRPDSVSSVNTKHSDQKQGTMKHHHLSTQSQSPNQPKDFSSTLVLYKPQPIRSISPLTTVNHRFIGARTTKESNHVNIKLKNNDSDGNSTSTQGRNSQQSGVLDVKNLLSNRQRTQQVNQKASDDRSRVSHTLTSSLESSNRSNFDYRRIEPQATQVVQSAYMKVLDKMKGQLKKNPNQTQTINNDHHNKHKRSLNTNNQVYNSDHPVINVKTSSRDSSNQQPVISANQEYVQFFN
ncbi:UNKNOWN [Stylonychia lemnae]|uniref:Uncharacterized protein n=1 Tax=Stylonychia lemnae TaxID=5949 RepID=A0A078A938_STYLE|nr:UNKNOWN [Stylonychia lemnae]|eukprot:CDW78739.1 UNKNOWN [Stylonychia lemnae]